VTRINLVAPSLLVRQHLIAEYRELPRIYALVRDAAARGETAELSGLRASPAYTLGTGHCRFFYTRLGWLTDRYAALRAEMQARGYVPAFDGPPGWAQGIGRAWWGAWTPTPACVALNVERINERLRGMGLDSSQLVLVEGVYRQQGTPPDDHHHLHPLL
jgi:hypothetical protein